MMHLFIDSNIWLSLYHFSNNDLNEFSKIKKMLDKEVNLIVTKQIIDEVSRNREAKIADALSKFSFQSMSIPSFCKNYAQYESFTRKYDEAKEEFNIWLNVIKKDVENNSAPADKLIKEIFDAVRIMEVNSEIYEKAVKRYNLGNPPGKNHSYGDAINWEVLLETVPIREDLYFISDDKDYKSIINKNAMNSFLVQEWTDMKQSIIHFYASLAGFVKEHIDNIILKNEKDKKDLIEALCNSGSFAMTHAIIAQMENYVDWSLDEADELCTAVKNNNQISWIFMDDDVRLFYKKMLGAYFVGDMTSNMLEVFDMIDGFYED